MRWTVTEEQTHCFQLAVAPHLKLPSIDIPAEAVSRFLYAQLLFEESQAELEEYHQRQRTPLKTESMTRDQADHLIELLEEGNQIQQGIADFLAELAHEPVEEDNDEQDEAATA